MKSLNRLVFFLFLLLPVFFIYSSFIELQTKVCYRIYNLSNYSVTEIALFSRSFQDLNQNKKSKYLKINFQKDQDDPMLYLTANQKRLAIYVSPAEDKGNYTFVIDSIDIERRKIYVNRIKD